MALWSKKSGTPSTADAAAPSAPAAPEPGAAPNAAAAAVESAGLSPEDRQKAIATSKAILASFGEIASVLMRSPAHKQLSIGDLEWMVVPAVVTGQFSVAGGHAKANGMLVPLAVVFWASVSPDVDKRLSASLNEPIKLQPNEWKSGDILWLVDAVGDPKLTRAIVKRLSAKEWGGKPVKFKGRDKDGAIKVGVLSADAAAA